MNGSSAKLFMGCFIAVLLLTGCRIRLPGQPTEADRWRLPEQVSDFNQLYGQNCAGCHGSGGKNGASTALNDALYMAFVTDEDLRQVISDGRPGTSMPAFSTHAGGNLSDQQIGSLISGMRAQWSRPDEFKGVTIPSYASGGNSTESNADAATAAGDGQSGATAYQTYCSRCHGTNGEGGAAGSIIDPHYLNLVSDQGLRTTVVVGRSDFGKPDWRSNLPGHPMSPQEIDGVVGWVAAHREKGSDK